MSNIIERNVTVSLVIYTITICAAMWAVSKFILNDNEVNNLKSKIDIMNERILHLQTENERLTAQNIKYFEWLQEIPQGISYFEKKIFELESVKTDTVFINRNGDNKIHSIKKYYYESEQLKVGSAFIDKETKATIGVNQIDVDRTIKGTITLPGKSSQDLNKIGPGKSWSFKFNGKEYQIMLSEVNYISNMFRITIHEL